MTNEQLSILLEQYAKNLNYIYCEIRKFIPEIYIEEREAEGFERLSGKTKVITVPILTPLYEFINLLKNDAKKLEANNG